MNILNIRSGFATNSSSSHSLVFIPNSNDLAKIRDKIKDSPSFGWEQFILKSPEEKRKYFASLMLTAVRNVMPSRIAALVTKDIVGYDNSIDLDSDNWTVDHQSAFEFPLTRDLKDINVEFVREFYNYIMQNNIVIVGGNDNGGNDVKDVLPKGIKFEEIDFGNFKNAYGTLIAKKQKDDIWTLFNIKSGSKICMSFSKNDFTLAKSRTPDLVDMKITDMCNEECAFCYQDSKPTGNHANLDDIIHIIDTLEDMEVFEIAFGGGDPTLHPNFSDILEYTKLKGIIPNFSTRSTKWLQNPIILQNVKENVGAVGFSMRSMREVEDLNYLVEKYIGKNDEKEHIYIHYVMGSTTLDELEEIISATADFGYSIILLDYKAVGRGASFTPYPYDRWIDLVMKRLPYGRFGVDTALAKKYKKELIDKGVSDRTYFIEEGKFSVYIDAVNMTIGPSSYCPKNNMSKIKVDGFMSTFEEIIQNAFEVY